MRKPCSFSPQRISPRQIKNQRGAALVLGMLLMLVMIMLGLTASGSAIMQEKIAGNFRDSSLAFQSTEAGARWGAAWLQSLGAATGQTRPFPCSSSCTATVSSTIWTTNQYIPATFNWATNGWTYGQNPTTAGVISGYETNTVKKFLLVDSPPKFVLTEQFFDRDDLSSAQERGVVYYQVAARGVGQRANTERVISTLLAKRFQ